jgi:hypothetical protein
MTNQNMAKYTLSFVCEKQWNELKKTSLPNVHYCDDCHKQVFIVKTESQFLAASALKRCVAISDNNGFIERVGFVDSPHKLFA